MPESFSIKLQATCNFIKKEALTQVFFCEFCKISNNTFVTGHLWTTASIVFNDCCTISHSYIIFNDELFDIKRLLQRARVSN